MKKLLSAVAALVLVLVGCSSTQEQDKIITVGASSVPHAEILEAAKPSVEAAGYELEIVVFEDYILPNKALEAGDLDANYFQHLPYLADQTAEFGYDFKAVAPIHVEPIGFYSKTVKSLDELADGATIILSNSIADHGRALSLLEDEGIIKLDPAIERSQATTEDIIENPKNLVFDYSYEASLLPTIYENGEGDAVLINTNYALSAGIDPSTAIAIEGSESDYANYVVVNSADENSEKTQVLVDALKEQSTIDFINETYEGAVVAV